MTYWVVALVVALGAFAVINVAASAVAMVVWCAAKLDAREVRAVTRARGLLLLRLMPAVASSLLVAGVVIPAFSVFEPRGHEESLGVSPLVLASVGAALFGWALARAWGTLRDTRGFLRAGCGQVRSAALQVRRVQVSVVHSPYPLVAVVGWVRPRLLVADRVLDACTPGELDAILAHETAHLVSRDNLKRFVLRCCPDVLGLTPVGRALERAWTDASEEAADDDAAGRTGRRLELAGALVKVARLAPVAGTPVPASALYHGQGFERRVRRLLETPRATVRPSGWLIVVHAAAAALVVGTTAAALDRGILAAVHSLIELAVSTLP